MKAKTRRAVTLQLRPRIMLGDHIAIGPGKAELLRLVGETGSISEAARRMKMSYMRAWTLFRTMNSCFCEPVIATTRGGKERGGAKLTVTGARLLRLYDQLVSQCLASTEATRPGFAALLKSSRK